jgi:hypothetical protein
MEIPNPWRRRTKFITIAVIVVAYLLIVWGVNSKHWAGRAAEKEAKEFGDEQTPSLATLRTNAMNSICADCSNEVVGLTRIVRVSVYQEGEVTNWTGEAIVEFVNKVGGVERTERSYRLRAVPNNEGGVLDVFAVEDVKKELKAIRSN